MNISVKIQGSSFSRSCRQFASEKTLAQIAQCSQAIERVRIHLDDLSQSSRREVNQMCRIVLQFKAHSFIVVEAVGDNMVAAIDRATFRISERLRRHPLPA